MTTSMREALERLDDAARGFGWNSDQYRARWKEVQAAISSHTLDRLSDEERRVIDGARSGGMANVGYRGLQTLLAIIDRLSCLS